MATEAKPSWAPLLWGSYQRERQFERGVVMAKNEIEKKLNKLKKIGKEAIPISVIDDKSIKHVEKILRDIIKQKYKETLKKD